MKYSIFLLFVLATFISCSSETKQADDKDNTKIEVQEPVKQKQYSITPFAPSTEYTDAGINGMKYQGGKFSFDLASGSYKLGVQTPDAPQKNCANSAKGQHIHLIVNNLPYAAKYESEFEYQMPDGEHFLLAFLSRSYHESIKTKSAHKAVKASVANKAITEAVDITDPMLFYSRPKGTYSGDDTKKVMLDFYVTNVDMNAHNVEAEINGEKHLLDTWQPYYVEGLPMGKNIIKLTLMDNDGNIVDTPLNPVSRTFTLEGKPAEN